jgi:hypothetical protein
MFTTFVLMCHVITKECVALKDVRGLHDTQEQCMIRAVELSSDITSQLPHMLAVQYKCLESKGEAT